jgi:hypothetical protein
MARISFDTTNTKAQDHARNPRRSLSPSLRGQNTDLYLCLPYDSDVEGDDRWSFRVFVTLKFSGASVSTDSVRHELRDMTTKGCFASSPSKFPQTKIRRD